MRRPSGSPKVKKIYQATDNDHETKRKKAFEDTCGASSESDSAGEFIGCSDCAKCFEYPRGELDVNGR
jgi:hypothetical protein